MITPTAQNNFPIVEFGVCHDLDEEESYFQIPIDANVQIAIIEMFSDTFGQLRIDDGAFEKFEPAQKYSATERLSVDLTDPSVEKIKRLYESINLATNGNALKDVQALAYYFAFLTDERGNRVLGVRRAMQFKGIIKARNRLMALVDDSLKLVDDDIFKLDNDFDYIVKGDTIYILRPSGFEFTASLDEAVASKALSVTKEVATSLKCVDFESMQNYIQTHKKAARLMASLRMRNDLHITPLKNLKSGCKKNEIRFDIVDGKIRPQSGFEMDFLEFLDRRRYNVSLVPKQTEYYVAPNRKGVQPHVAATES